MAKQKSKCIPGTQIPKPVVVLSKLNPDADTYEIIKKCQASLWYAFAPAEAFRAFYDKCNGCTKDQVIKVASEFCIVR